MAEKTLPSPEVLRQLLRYEPDTGKLFWLPRPASMFLGGRNCAAWNSRCAGKEALNSQSKGYLHGTLNCVTVQTHRIAWAVHYGAWPDGLIDHRDGDGTNNRLANMRVGDSVMNGRNMKIGKANTSSVVGVTWHKDAGKWMAQIVVHRKRVHLGLHRSFADAVAARRAAEIENGFHPNKRSA